MQVQGRKTDFMTVCVSIWINHKLSNNEDKICFAIANGMSLLCVKYWTGLYTTF